MKLKTLKSVCLVAFAFIASTNLFAQMNNELKAKIEKLNKEMAAAMVAGNSEKSLSFYTDDAISLPDHGQMLEGKEAIKKSNEDMMKSGSKVTSFETNTLKVMGSGKTITEIGTYQIGFTMPGKTDPMTDTGKYLTVWEKQSDGSLKVKIEMWNSNTSMMDMSQKNNMEKDKTQ